MEDYRGYPQVAVSDPARRQETGQYRRLADRLQLVLQGLLRCFLMVVVAFDAIHKHTVGKIMQLFTFKKQLEHQKKISNTGRGFVSHLTPLLHNKPWVFNTQEIQA